MSDKLDDDREDTNRVSTRDVELDFLSRIHDKLTGVDTRLKMLEEQVLILAQNVSVVHQFQRSFADRLSGVEKFCVERPLRPLVRSDGGNRE